MPYAPDLLLANANVITMDPARPRATAVAVAGGRIAAVGDDAAELAAGSAGDVLDLKGATLVPGFHDAHNHMLAFGLSLAEVDLRTGSLDELYAQVAARAGWRVAAHAIGDRAIDLALDAFDAAASRYPRRDARHRIEHFAAARPDQVARAAALGVIPVGQGRFATEIGDGMLAAVGPARHAWLYRQRSVLDAGLVLPGSSDRPVVAGTPLLGIHDMVNRRTAAGAPFNAAEAVTAEEALRAYTWGSAYASKAEHVKGSIEPGKLADFTVLSEDPTAVGPSRIAGRGHSDNRRRRTPLLRPRLARLSVWGWVGRSGAHPSRAVRLGRVGPIGSAPGPRLPLPRPTSLWITARSASAPRCGRSSALLITARSGLAATGLAGARRASRHAPVSRWSGARVLDVPGAAAVGGDQHHPAEDGNLGSAPPTFLPSATANPVSGEMKCTDLITGHGSASAVQRAPPSVVASSDVVPTAQPSCPLMKSTEVRLSLPDSCLVQCAPPSAVARIVSWLTAQPRDGDTNCRPSMPGGYEGDCAPAHELPCAGAPAAAPGAAAPADTGSADAEQPTRPPPPPKAPLSKSPRPRCSPRRNRPARRRPRPCRSRARRRQRKEQQRQVTAYACPVDGATAAAVVPQPTYVNAGMTSVANNSAERSVSASVMSPNANSSEK